jgi:type II secretory pathway component PulC
VQQPPSSETSLAETEEVAPAQPFIIGEDPDTAAPDDDEKEAAVAAAAPSLDDAAPEPDRAIIDRHDEHERLTTPPATAAAPAADPPPLRRAASTPEPEPARAASRDPASRDCDIAGVTRHSSSRYTLSRNFINRYIRDQDRAQRQGSAGWRKNRQQDIVGIRVRNLRCAPQTAGLQNNDVIKTINGRSMTGITSVLAAYSEIKRGNNFTVKVRRDGQPLTIQYLVE